MVGRRILMRGASADASSMSMRASKQRIASRDEATSTSQCALWIVADERHAGKGGVAPHHHVVVRSGWVCECASLRVPGDVGTAVERRRGGLAAFANVEIGV